jgi:hypothetical protein
MALRWQVWYCHIWLDTIGIHVHIWQVWHDAIGIHVHILHFQCTDFVMVGFGKVKDFITVAITTLGLTTLLAHDDVIDQISGIGGIVLFALYLI